MKVPVQFWNDICSQEDVDWLCHKPDGKEHPKVEVEGDLRRVVLDGEYHAVQGPQET